MLIDIIVAVIVIISAIISFLRGFIREVLTIAGVIGGLAAAYFFGPLLAPTFQNWFGVDLGADKAQKLFDLIPMDILATVVAYASIFVLFVIIISVISHFTAGAVKALGLGPVDRSLGVIFGIVRGLVLLGLIYLPFHLLMTSDTKSDLFAESRTHIFIEKTAVFLAGFLPNSSEVEEKIEKVADEKLKDKLMEQDLLKGAQDLKEKIQNNQSETGYEEDHRNELEDLFEQKEGAVEPVPRSPDFNE